MYIASDRIFKALLLYFSNEHKTDIKHAGLMVWGDKNHPWPLVSHPSPFFLDRLVVLLN